LDPFISLDDLGKKRMVLIIQAGDRNWNLADILGWKIVVQEAMPDGIEEPSQRKKGNQRYDQKPMP
jgi:hypothetical protein